MTLCQADFECRGDTPLCVDGVCRRNDGACFDAWDCDSYGCLRDPNDAAGLGACIPKAGEFLDAMDAVDCQGFAPPPDACSKGCKSIAESLAQRGNHALFEDCRHWTCAEGYCETARVGSNGR
jgi:hypothetical protein